MKHSINILKSNLAENNKGIENRCKSYNSLMIHNLEIDIKNKNDDLEKAIQDIKISNGKYHLEAMNQIHTMKEELAKYDDFRNKKLTFEMEFIQNREIYKEIRIQLKTTKLLIKDNDEKMTVYY